MRIKSVGLPRFRVQGAGCRVQGAGCRVQGAGCRVDLVAREPYGFREASRVLPPNANLFADAGFKI